MTLKPPILITGARAPVALHMARLLLDAGHAVTLVDHLKHPLSAASQLKIPYVQIPSFSEDPDATGDALTAIVDDQQIELVVPTCEEVLHLGALWDRAPPNARLFAPGFEDLKQVHHKFEFIRLCDTLGLPTPGTHLISTQDDLTKVAQNARSLVFKPVWSRFASQVLIRPKTQALKKLRPTKQNPWVAQDYIDGTEFCIYAIAREGRLVAFSAYRGLVRAGPGAAVCFAPEHNQALRDFAQTIVSATGWTGQISFDVIQGKDGQLYPLECNPRSTSGLHFFADGSAFSDAIFGQRDEVAPDVATPLTVPLALWLYGLPMMLGSTQRPVFLDAVRRSGDVFSWPGDHLGLGAQLRALSEFACIAFKRRISLQRASTWGIEWNGED